MTIQHIVSFAFPSTTPSILAEVSRRFFELKETCLNEKGDKYIVSIKGGKQDNWEERNKGLTHVYLLEFKTHEERKYYIEKDPIHNEFKIFVGPLVSDALVLDFTENVW